MGVSKTQDSLVWPGPTIEDEVHLDPAHPVVREQTSDIKGGEPEWS